MQPTPSDKAIARHLEAVFGKRPKIRQHSDGAAEPFVVGIAEISGYPTPDLVTLSTVGVSNHPLHDGDGDEIGPAKDDRGLPMGPMRVEFIASCVPGDEDDLREALLAAARYVGPLKGAALPGSFIRDLIGEYRADSPVPHGFLTDPFPYDGIDDINQFEGLTVAWLQVIPVSDAEIAYAEAHSTDALQEKFAEADIEWESLDRDSAV